MEIEAKEYANKMGHLRDWNSPKIRIKRGFNRIF